MPDIVLKRGNLVPVIAAALTNADGTPINLTGASVTFNLQGVGGAATYGFTAAATIVSAVAGTVTYTFAAGQTDLPGDYQAEWMIVFPDSSTRRLPETAYLTVQILDALPVTAPSGVTLVRDSFEFIRAILGDFHPEFRRYEDTAVASVVKTVLKTGRVPGHTLTANQLGITPEVTAAKSFALLIYHAAKMLLGPNVAAYSYRRRAAAETFGNQREFLWELNNALYEAENDDVFVSFVSFGSWVEATTGINPWLHMTEAQITAPVATVYIGPTGISHSTL